MCATPAPQAGLKSDCRANAAFCPTYTGGIRDCDVCHKRGATHGADLLPNFAGDSAPLLLCDRCPAPDGYARPVQFR